MKLDYRKFEGNLPYSSELYGIYHPLLGWKSKQIVARITSGLDRVRQRYLSDLMPRFTARYNYNHAPDPREAQFKVELAEPNAATASILAGASNSIIGQRVSELIRQNSPQQPDTWREFTRPDLLLKLLDESRDKILAEYRAAADGPLTAGMRAGNQDPSLLLTRILARESVVGGLLAYLNKNADGARLQELLNRIRPLPSIDPLAGFIETLDPAHSDLAQAVVSPIGMVHLFRQYFFEFDSFLGPSVQHLWLSPGGTVELVEVSTRRTLVERVTEQAFETLDKSEKSATTQDELSEAVRTENSASTKLGVSASGSVGYKAPFVSASASVSASLNVEQNQKEAREQTHKELRQQTEKLSSEIRKSYKSTFRTVTENTDVTSKRYVIQNTTPKLLNYELRRKMRQVGVQVQDYGTHLCWQSFVDDPGNELGVSTLVHIAQPADLQGIKEPDKPTQPEPEISAPARSLTAHWGGDDDNPHNGFVPFVSRLLVVPPKPGYLYSRSEVEVVSGPHWWFRARPETSTDTTIDFEAGALTLGGNDVDMIDTGDGSGKTEASIKTIWVGAQMPPSSMTDDGDYDWTLKVTLFFRPSLKLQHDITVDYNLRLKDYSDAKKLAMQETVFKEARDRVKAASNIQPRRFDDLREEERTVVYRTLIRQLLRVAGINDEDHRVRHIFSELVESLFDVDRMLYFVAPEWWMPRFAPLLHRTQQDVGLQGDQGTFDKSELVSWGGAKALRPDNYYLTEDSTPAKLGSSLGWLIQLDGDNLRNAFLNAPWVKAIIPIRAGREWRALGWLSSQQIEGADGLDALYAARDAAERQHIVDILKANTWDDPAQAARYTSLDPNAITILDAINYLIVRIRAKQLVETTSMPDPADPTLGYLPTDQVFEHGFNPLQGGFRADPKDSVAHAFEVFDQWVEVLPTDQIVPVEVSYDPKTGMQI